MKVWVLAGVLSAVAFPTAAAADTIGPCQTEEVRSVIAPDRAEMTSVSAAPAAARPAATQREASDTRGDPTRRRSGKRVPDAELIGPRGAL